MLSGRRAFQTCFGFSSYFVLYLMCCFVNNPLYMDFQPIKIMFCSVQEFFWGGGAFKNKLILVICLFCIKFATGDKIPNN